MKAEQKELDAERFDVEQTLAAARRARPQPASHARHRAAIAPSANAATAALATTTAAKTQSMHATEGDRGRLRDIVTAPAAKTHAIHASSAPAASNEEGDVRNQPSRLRSGVSPMDAKALPQPPLATEVAKGPSSPRRGHAAKRPPPQREAMAALDPEAAERRLQIEMLRQRMKAASLN